MRRMTFPAGTLALLALTTTALIGATVAAPATQVSQMQNFGPANDDLANAETLLADLQLIPGDLAYSTRELKEPRVGTSSIARSVWYRYEATETGRAVAFITKRNSPAPFQLAVYGGTGYADLKKLGSVQVLGTSTDYSGAVGFNAVAGTTYWIQVGRAPMASGDKTAFLLGVQPVGTKGKLAAFANHLLVFQESFFQGQRRVFVANGHTGTVTLTHTLTNMGRAVAARTTATTLSPNKTALFTITDGYSNFTNGNVHVGALNVTARATSNGSVLGTTSVPVRVVTALTPVQPVTETRFEDPMPGAPVGGRAQSVVHVRNTSANPAPGCRFDTLATDDSLAAIRTREILPNGDMGPVNPIFTLAPHETRKFVFSGRVAASSTLRDATLRCLESNVILGAKQRAYFQPTAFFGIHPNVRVRPTTDDVFGNVALADSASKRVYVTLKNAGAYSGNFLIRARGDTTLDRAVVMSMCIVNGSNVCTSPSNSERVLFDMAVGETKRLAVDVRRGTVGPGEVQLTVYASDYDTTTPVGYGAFTLKK